MLVNNGCTQTTCGNSGIYSPKYGKDFGIPTNGLNIRLVVRMNGHNSDMPTGYKVPPCQVSPAAA